MSLTECSRRELLKDKPRIVVLGDDLLTDNPISIWVGRGEILLTNPLVFWGAGGFTH